MIQFLLAAPRSGSGKTTMTCALLMALKRRGCAPCAFKSGPDYIDPMFHRAVLGVESRSLDLFFSAPETVRTLYARGAAGHGAAVCEGAMGFYDGLGGVSDRASAWHLADTLGLPVLLVVEPKGQSLTLAAELKGLVNFRTPSHIAGILLNNCTARMHALLAPMLEEETGLPVLGFLPKLPEPSSVPAIWASTRRRKWKIYSRSWLFCRRGGGAHRLAPPAGPLRKGAARPAGAAGDASGPRPHRRGAGRGVLLCLRRDAGSLPGRGAEVVFFSPLRDTALPENIGGLYLPGGYPELHAKELSENTSLLREIKQKIESGLPTAAECGGFLYLGQSLTDAEGQSWPMAGVCRAKQKMPDVSSASLRRAERRLGQSALPGRGELSHPRIPPLGFHRQWHGSRGKKAGGRRRVAVRICKRAFLCGLPAFVLGGYAPAAALCRRG